MHYGIGFGMLFPLVLGAVCWLLFQLGLLLRNMVMTKRFFPSWRKNLLFSAMFFYFLLMTGITQFPLSFGPAETLGLEGWLSHTRVNFIPFHTILGDFLSPPDYPTSTLPLMLRPIIGNIVLFVPLGLFLPFTRQRKLGQVMLIASLASFGIESLQFFLGAFNHWRQPNIDDIMLNTLGAIGGFGLYHLLPKKLRTFFFVPQQSNGGEVSLE